MGAGLTGLATGRFLTGKADVRIFEALNDIGGLARSYQKRGFTCDMTGHLLHLRRATFQGFVKRLLRDNIVHVDRHSSIYCNGRATDYPFQANLYGQPEMVRRDCLLEFPQEQRSEKREKFFTGSFKRWIEETFGAGIARHFMVPYNEKLWCCDLVGMTADWISWSVPQPSLDEVVRGTLAPQRKKFGYNANFLYPAHGGIGTFSRALAAPVEKRIRKGIRAVSLDLLKHELGFSDGSLIRYDRLVSTIPLPALTRMTANIPFRRSRAANLLRSVNVVTFNMGFRGARRSDAHWTYFPEKKFPFYRVGFPSNFAPALAPRGCSSAYVEVAYPAGGRPRVDSLYRRVLDGLREWGVVTSERDIVMVDAQFIAPAYVIFDRNRPKVRASLLHYFKKHGVFSAGRYGQWDYLSMEDSLCIGRNLSQTVCR